VFNHKLAGLEHLRPRGVLQVKGGGHATASPGPGWLQRPHGRQLRSACAASAAATVPSATRTTLTSAAEAWAYDSRVTFTAHVTAGTGTCTTRTCAGTSRCTGPARATSGCLSGSAGRDTDWHDHGGSSGSFAVEAPARTCGVLASLRDEGEVAPPQVLTLAVFGIGQDSHLAELAGLAQELAHPRDA
jgi:hypothetical protein